MRRYWWHRLSIVLFIVSCVPLAFMAGAVNHAEPALRPENVVILETLGSYTDAHPELANSVPSFERLGQVAFRDSSGNLRNHYLLDHDHFCSADLGAHSKEVADFLLLADPAAYRDMDAAKAKEWISAHEVAGEKGNCIVRNVSDAPDSSSIVVYRFATAALIRNAAIAAAWSVGIVVLWTLFLLNAYYRGLIFVVFGSRARTAQHRGITAVSLTSEKSEPKS